MPFFTMGESKSKGEGSDSNMVLWDADGEFTDAAMRIKQPGKPGRLHSHDDEEQWTIVLEGQMHFVIGEEELICGPGDVAFVPRHADHCSHAVDGAAVFFRVTHKTKTINDPKD